MTSLLGQFVSLFSMSRQLYLDFITDPAQEEAVHPYCAFHHVPSPGGTSETRLKTFNFGDFGILTIQKTRPRPNHDLSPPCSFPTMSHTAARSRAAPRAATSTCMRSSSCLAHWTWRLSVADSTDNSSPRANTSHINLHAIERHQSTEPGSPWGVDAQDAQVAPT